jgi:LacI family transcriptional regulator
MGKVTLKDIAREVGVSPSTVSLVLNGRYVRVSDAKRQAILECARQKHYVPNQIARSLVSQRSDTLGLIIPNIESRFFSSLAKHLEQRCRKIGYALLIANSDDVPENDAELVRLFVNRGVDGIFLVAASGLAPDPDLAEMLSSLPVPYLMVDRVLEGVAGDSVSFDNVLGGYLATKHLVEHGHRRIACVANMQEGTGRKRVQGYEKALSEAGIAPDPALELQSRYYIPDAYHVGDAVIATGATGVVATSDNIALGLLKRLYERKLRVPQDLSIVSYDNSTADSLFEPALTSIEQNVNELSEASLSLMLARLRGTCEDTLQTRLLAPKLVSKDSVRDV